MGTLVASTPTPTTSRSPPAARWPGPAPRVIGWCSSWPPTASTARCPTTSPTARRWSIGLRLVSRRPDSRHGRARRLHGPLATGADPRPRRSLPRPAARDVRARRPRGGWTRDWSFSFQSESPTGEPWLGPDILDHLTALHDRGIDGRARVPRRVRIGSSGNPLGHGHRGARGRRRELGMRLERIEMPNAEPAFHPRPRRNHGAGRRCVMTPAGWAT